VYAALQVPLQLYKESMVGVRKYLLRHIFDGVANMSFVSEARGVGGFQISATNDRFEHLTCFAGGMFLLGECGQVGCGSVQQCEVTTAGAATGAELFSGSVLADGTEA
jgi:hypothetical protein